MNTTETAEQKGSRNDATNATKTIPVPKDRTVLVEEIQPSKTNPRKTFDPAKLEELKASIAEKGLISALVVRPIAPVKGADGEVKNFELVAGERRLRCCVALGLEQVRCSVYELTDQQALEFQMIENLQRDDLNPLEEAEGYEALIKGGQYSAKDLAARLNKSTVYIYERLKLVALPPPARQALLDGRMGLYAARKIACLPHEEWRKEATKLVLEPRKHDDLLEDAEIDAYELPDEPLTAAMAGKVIQAVYMRSLAGAPFDLKDGNVLPAAGPCTTCPKRAGNAPELFPDLRADMCTDLKCYRAKVQAAQDLLSASARAKGMKVLTAPEAAKILHKNYQGKYVLGHSAAYVDPDEKPGYDEVVDRDKAGTWKQLVKGREVPVVLAFDGEGKPHELYPRKLALEAGKQNKPAVFRRRDTSAGNAERKKEEARLARERKIEQVAFADAMDAITAKIETDKLEKGLGAIFTSALLAYVVQLTTDWSGSDALEAVLTRRRVEFKEGGEPAALAKHLKESHTPQSRAAIALELLLTHDHQQGNGGGDITFAQAYKVDLAKIKAEARDTVLHQEKAEAEKLKQAELATKAAPGKSQGKIGERIVAALKAGGAAGVTVKDLAATLGEKPGNIFSWFHTSGKKVKEIRKVGEAKYAHAEAAK